MPLSGFSINDLPLPATFPVFISDEYTEVGSPNSDRLSFVEKDSQGALAVVRFIQSEFNWFPTLKNPIGSFYVDEKFDPTTFIQLLSKIEEEAKMRNVATINVRISDFGYQCFKPLHVWIDNGFTIVNTEFQQWLSLVEPINYHQMQVRKLRKGRELNFEICKHGESTFPQVFEFIQGCRLYQKIPLNITRNEFEKMYQSMPNLYDVWSISRDSQMMGALILTHVTDRIIYYFLSATHQEFKKASPMVMLINHVIHHYRSLNFQYLDMGISSINGELQESLWIFKSRMGAVTQHRYDLQKTIK